MLQITQPDTIILSLQQRQQDSLRRAENFNLIKQTFKESLSCSFSQVRIPDLPPVLPKPSVMRKINLIWREANK